MQLAIVPIDFPFMYHCAEKEYEKGRQELLIEDFHPNNFDISESNFNCSKKHFATCVFLLRDLYSRRQVESIASLPFEEEIEFFDRSQTKNLSYLLGELYFNKG